MQAYSDPDREDNPYALPDIDIWRSVIYESTCCNTKHPESYIEAAGRQPCFTCGKPAEYIHQRKRAWWYWFCFPGCLPDSDPHGPFATYEDALADAQDNS